MKRNLYRETETEQWASGYTFLFAIAVLCGECSGSSTLLELQKLQNRADRILTKRAFDAPSNPIIKKIGRMKIADLISFESNQLLFKSLNN